MLKWLHHLLNPHCESCKEDRDDKYVCKSCEILKQQLDIVNYEKKQLLESLLNLNKPVIKDEVTVSSEPIQPKTIPWAVRKQLLEQEDREKARAIKRYNESTEKLEKDLGLDMETLSNASSQREAV